ncbi:uncharacterized protein LOC129737726 [Uranotaenia lowii]|uniref:uncharacterized protein LOC129737726 n=1 Tax=Uranotaenia lowii TaxID=190385 RepID=UPI00247ABDCE|nr:uncharacterized protein LOC129737726 [Uranotaenia lowii]
MNKLIELYHLNDEEMEYELALRHVTNLAPCSRRARVVKLKALVQEDTLRDTIYVNSEHVMSPELNIEVCQRAVVELRNQVDLATQNRNADQMACAKSRLLHYRQRLSLIPVVASLEETRRVVCELVETLLAQIECVNSAVNMVLSETENTSLSTSVPTIQAENSSSRDACDALTIPPRPQAAGNDEGARARMQEADVEPSSLPFQGGRQGQRDSEEVIIRRSGSSAGLAAVNVLDELRFDIQQRQRRQQQLNDSFTNRSGSNYDRRMQKAIHNWPFKFRGEKDTTSLNIFLDRHLLLEDALDWYSRALAQRRLYSWQAFKQEIRREFLPSGYAQILRLEASFRFQGANETFDKFFRDISTLFRFIDPPLTEEEKLFIVKKNMNMDYATIVTAAQPKTLMDLVNVCSNFDETRLLLNQQRRIPIPHNHLLEPNFATPATTSRSQQHQQQRFGRLQAVEADEQLYGATSYSAPSHRLPIQQPRLNRVHAVENEAQQGAASTSAIQTEADPVDPEDANGLQGDFNQLYEQVCAMKLQLERRSNRFNTGPQQQHSQQRPEQRQQLPTTSAGQNNLRSGKRRSEEVVDGGPDSSQHSYQPSIPPDLLDINSIIINPGHDNRPHAVLDVLGKKVTALLDSGANCSLLGGSKAQIVEELGLRKEALSGGIKTADGTPHQINHFTRLPISYNNRSEILPVLLVPSLPDCAIMGMNFWQTFGVKAVCFSIMSSEIEQDAEPMKALSPEQQKRLDQVVHIFPKAEDGKLGRTQIYEHQIDVGNAPPRKQRYYPMSQYVLAEVNKEVDRMLSLDVIEEAVFSPWNNPLVAVKKKDGRYRVCLDARHLNSIMVNEGYPIPQISAIINNLGGCSYISSIDLKDAFWQMPLQQKSRPLTAFTVPSRGHYQFKVVPFGICTASQGLARLMTHLFADMEPFVFHYLDDIIICSKTFDEHVAVLQEVATRLRQANLTISPEKSKFCRQRIKYLGYVLSEGGWRVDEEKVESIVKFPVPNTRKEVQRFLGLCGWYRRFIPEFSRIAAPITELTKAKIKFRWTTAAEEAFLKLKSALVTAPVLAMPDYTKPFSIACDASDVAIGAVLTQDIEGEEHPISYFSQKLSSSERKYTVTEKECLAVIRAIEKFRGYIEGVRFVVYCDHSALSYLKTLKNPTALMSRWLLRLNAFDFEIRYRKGSCNTVPDALSRVVCSLVFSISEENDPWYKNIVKQVERKGDKYPDFRIANNELYKNCHCKDEAGLITHRWKKVVPENHRAELIRRYHDAPSAAHLGFQKTWHKLQQHYYWPKMQDNVARYVKACTTCKASKAPNIRMMPQMGKLKPAKVPWELISIDFVGPLTRSKKGNTALLVIVDWITKYVIAHPMRAADSTKMVEFLEEKVFLKFSRPRIILSDNGKQFESQVFRALLSRHNIIHMKTAFYAPQVNNAERVNRVLITCVRSLLEEDHREWDKNLAAITAAINSAKHESTGVSPHFANFGRELLLHTDLYTLQDLNVSDDPKVAQEMRLSTINRIHKFIQQRIKKTHEKTKKRYDLQKRTVSFQPGELVWRRSFVLSSKADHINKKLDPKFIPAIVKEKLGANLYTLEDVVTGKRGRYHVKDIKPD